MEYFLRPDAQGLMSTDLYLIFMSWITGLVSQMGPTDRKLCLQSMCVRSNSSNQLHQKLEGGDSRGCNMSPYSGHVLRKFLLNLSSF